MLKQVIEEVPVPNAQVSNVVVVAKIDLEEKRYAIQLVVVYFDVLPSGAIMQVQVYVDLQVTIVV